MPFQSFDPSAAVSITSSSQSGPLTSGWLSLSQLRTELSNRLGGRSDIDADRLNLWLNEAYIDLCNALDLAVLRSQITHTMTVGRVDYKLPANIRMAVAISYEYDGCGGLIDKIDPEEYRRIRIQYDSGAPVVWTPFMPELIVFYPSPDVAYPLTLDVKLRPTRMTLDAHYPILPDEYIEGLLLLARSKAFSALMEFSLGGQCMNEYVSFMRSRRNEVAEQDEGRVGRIVPVRSQKQFLTSKRRVNGGLFTSDD